MNVERRAKYINGFGNSPKKEKEIDVNIDVATLDIMCKFVVSNNQTIRRGQLVNLKKFIEQLSKKSYENDIEKEKRISFIKKGIEARLEFNLTDPYMIISHIYGAITDTGVINLDDYKALTGAEIQWISIMISESLKYSHAYRNADMLIDLCTRLKTSEYSSKSQIVAEFEKAITKVQNDFRRSKNESITDEIFSLRDDYFENVMYNTYNTLKSPRRKLITGMQGMNELLGGGYENGRCYVYFGLPGEGKSSTILNIIYQIKKYNKNYAPKDQTKRPCIALLTMENTVTESIERLFGLATNMPSMTNFSPEDAIRMLREDGELYLSDESPIDIVIKYEPSNSKDTSYLYTLTEDLEDQGMEVIAMFQDYIGRIRSTEHLQDTRLEYGLIVDEFKTYAEIKDIPVITVAQLNRDASKHIDEGRQKAKSDLVRLIGRSNISESMLILNNIDAGFLIAPETTKDGERYLGVQRIKIRYKAGNRDFVYLPFIGESLKLQEDYGGIATFKSTMRSDGLPGVGGIVQSAYQTNAVVDMGQVLRSSSSENNIFSTNVISSLDPSESFKTNDIKLKDFYNFVMRKD